MGFNNVNYVSKGSWGELSNDVGSKNADARRRDCAILDKLHKEFGLYDQEPKWDSS